MQLAYEGAGGVGRLLIKALTGEGVPLMRCTGRGEVFPAPDGNEWRRGRALQLSASALINAGYAAVWRVRTAGGAALITQGAVG